MDAMQLLGGMLGSGFGKGRGPGLGTVAGVAVGAAAVGGLGYLAYQHFKPGAPPGLPGAAPAAFGGQPPMGAGPQMGGFPGGPPAPGGGFLEGMLGASGGVRTGDFASSGYGWQGSAAAAAPPAPGPQAAWSPPRSPNDEITQLSVGQAPALAPAAAPTMSAADYAKLPAMPVSPYDDTVAVASPEIVEARRAIKAAEAATEQQKQALLLVRAMVAAANADGAVDASERADILARLDASGISPAEREGFVRELDAPKPVTALVAEVKSPELAEQFYLVSVLSMSVDTDAERAYARMLPPLLNLSSEQVVGIRQRAGLPAAT